MVSWHYERRKNSTLAASSPNELIDKCARLEARLGIVTITPDEPDLDFVRSEIERLVRPGDIVQESNGAIQVLAAGANYDGVRAIASRVKSQLKDLAGHVYGTSEDAKSFKERLKESSVLRMAVGLTDNANSDFSDEPLSKDELVKRVTEAYAINPKVFTKAQVTYFVPKEGESADYVHFEPWPETARHIPADYPKLLRPSARNNRGGQFDYDVKINVKAGAFVVFAKKEDDHYEFDRKNGIVRKNQKAPS